MLAIFTTFKPFTDPHIRTIQRNALQSWIRLSPSCQVLLGGNEEGVKELCNEFRVIQVEDISRNSHGLPLFRSLLSSAEHVARFPYLCYVNGDIIFLDDFVQALQSVIETYNNFLVVGRRWDLEITSPLMYSNDWQEKLRFLVREKGTLHGASGIDFLVFPKGILKDIPPLVVGRGGWDNWMIFYARRHRIPVIDITKVSTVIHQNHDIQGTREKAKRFIDESAQANMKFAGGPRNLFTIRDADWVLNEQGFYKKFFSFLSLWYPWRLLISWKRKISQHLKW